MPAVLRDSCQFLIIDDDPAISRFLVTYLRQKGHTCQALTDGFQTAAWLADNDCDVAIVDLRMPKVEGISPISFIREMNPHIPIVLFTLIDSAEEKIHAEFTAEANCYVSNNLAIEQLHCLLA